MIQRSILKEIQFHNISQRSPTETISADPIIDIAFEQQTVTQMEEFNEQFNFEDSNKFYSDYDREFLESGNFSQYETNYDFDLDHQFSPLTELINNDNNDQASEDADLIRFIESNNDMQKPADDHVDIPNTAFSTDYTSTYDPSSFLALNDIMPQLKQPLISNFFFPLKKVKSTKRNNDISVNDSKLSFFKTEIPKDKK
jgi:hypothetical protein